MKNVLLFIVGLLFVSQTALANQDDLETSRKDAAMDSAGVLYLVEEDAGQVTAVQSDGERTVLARDLDRPCLVAVDLRRNIYVYCRGNGAVLRLEPDLRLTEVARPGPGVEALEADRDGNLYLLFADREEVVIIPGPLSGVITGYAP